MAPRVVFDRLARLLALALTGLGPASALALPSLQTASETDDDAQVTLSIPVQAIANDARSYCQVRVQVGSTEVALKAGDSVDVAVYEDDLAGDDLVFQTVFQVTTAEVQAGKVDRTLDCTGPFASDATNDELEVYAQVEVVKADCGWTCLYDRPTTSNLQVPTLEDDGDEPNDSSTGAKAVSAGIIASHIAATSEDWYSFQLAGSSALTVTLTHRASAGVVQLAVLDTPNHEAGATVVTGDSAKVEIGSAPAGTYYVKVRSAVATDPNFYDLDLAFTSTSTSCTPGTTESLSCGNCGTKTRTCEAGGTWGAFTPCSGQGACVPDTTSAQSCGLCGTRPVTCTATCTWEESACDDPCADSEATLGGPCATSGACSAGMTCLVSPQRQVYAGGYCSKTACTTDAACGADGICARAFGEDVCLARCARNEDCRDSDGYACADFGGAKGCLPKCTDDADCTDADFDTCQLETGLCVNAAGDPGTDPGTTPDDGGDDEKEGGVASEGGCQSARGDALTLLTLFLVGLFAGRVRHRREAWHHHAP